MRSKLVLLVALIVTGLLYSPGLSGPFLLDDHAVLLPVELWHADQYTWQQTLLPNSSILFSRPIAMGSFMLTTWLGGVGPLPYKLGNLTLHLACGVLIWLLLFRVVARDARMATHARFIATAATTVWLIHPLHVSTVLYAVQRMAQLSALFTLAAIAIYLHARQQWNRGSHRPALLNLFLTFPALVLAGILSKQNAAVAPFICLVLELAYFGDRLPRPKPVRVFFSALVVLPGLALTALLLIAPERLLAGYAGWDFTLTERLLTQPRALFSYICMWFVPRSPLMGLYTDDFAVSTSLLSPASTAFAMLALVGGSAIAIRLRKRAPSIFAGWFFFLAAHGVESSFLPIEMYYEHRNYLPSVGLLLLFAGVCSLLVTHVQPHLDNPRKLVALTGTGLVLTLAFATLGRVLVWQDDAALVEQGLRQHPRSLRAVTDSSVLALWRKDYKKAFDIVAGMRASDLPRHRVIGNLQTVAVGCLNGRRADPIYLSRSIQDMQPEITVFEVQAAKTLVNVTGAGDCGDVSVAAIADTLVAMLNVASAQPEETDVKYAIRTMAAQLYARSGRWQDAELHARIAWDATGHAPAGALLTDALLQNGKRSAALPLLREIERKVRPFDIVGQKTLDRLRTRLAQVSAARAPSMQTR